MKKPPNKILRVGVLLSFALLISGFVLYKSGILEMKSSLYPEDNSQELSAAERDSIQVVADSLKHIRFRIVSSKVMLVRDPPYLATMGLLDSLERLLDSATANPLYARTDTLKPKPLPITSADTFMKVTYLMSSSKSRSVFTPDTVSAKLLKQLKSYKPRKTLLSGSKSISNVISPDSDSVSVKLKK